MQDSSLENIKTHLTGVDELAASSKEYSQQRHGQKFCQFGCEDQKWKINETFLLCK